jgi:pyruvate dehydrogenase E1 component alpha subunit
MAVDGQDIMAVYEAAEEAVRRAREGGGPTLMECKTYRFMGHMGGKEMLASYRTQEELDEWLQRDPITLFEENLVRTGTMTKEQAVEIDEKIKANMDEAVKFAAESPWPEPEEALDDVYA